MIKLIYIGDVINFMTDIEILKKIKYIEDRLNILENIIYSVQKTSDNIQKNYEFKLDQINREINQIKKDIDDIKIKINAIYDQLKLFATIDQIKVIDTMLEAINPMDFVTKKEVEKIVKRILKEYLNKNIEEI